MRTRVLWRILWLVWVRVRVIVSGAELKPFSEFSSAGGEVKVDVLVFESPPQSLDEEAAGGSDSRGYCA